MSESKSLDKTTLSIIYYFISSLNGVLGKTHLQKLLFLSDLMSTKKFGEGVTKIDYKRYLHGPYSPQVDSYTGELISKNMIEAREFAFNSDPDKKYIRYYVSQSFPIKQNLMDSLGADKFVILDDVVKSFGNMSLNSLLDIIYDLQIVKKSEMDEPLDIAKNIEEEENPDISEFLES